MKQTRGNAGRIYRKASPTAPKCDVINPRRICGWAEHMAIHQPILTGPRAGQPFDHTYMPVHTERVATPVHDGEGKGS